MAQDLFMHPQSCIIQELNEENNEPTTSGTEHIDGAPTATEASSPENQQQISASVSAAAEPAADVPVSSAVDGGEVKNQSEAERVEQPVDPQLQQLLDDCEHLKQEGNTAYGRGEYDEALQLYWQVTYMICNTFGASNGPQAACRGPDASYHSGSVLPAALGCSQELSSFAFACALRCCVLFHPTYKHSLHVTACSAWTKPCFSRPCITCAGTVWMQAIDQAPENAQQRAVYLCNAAACYLKKEMWQLAAEQCTQALKLNEIYLKVSSSSLCM